MSLGSRSGVNWMRCQVASIEAAIALARVVLPTPGTSSTNRCPPANRQVSASLTAAGLPVMARSTLPRTASYTALKNADGSCVGSDEFIGDLSTKDGGRARRAAGAVG